MIDNFLFTSEILRRIGRRMLWARPTLYWPIGRYRGRIPANLECDVWVGGYPRSANTFLWKFLQAALPDARVIGHLHFPPLIIRQLQEGRPGVFVIRDPLHAVVSASIFTGLPLQHSLDYYVDFHHVMWRFREKLMVAPFEDVIESPHAIVETLASQFHFTNYNRSALAGQPLSQLMTAIEEMPYSLNKDGQINEMRVSRPSPQRSKQAAFSKQELQTSAVLRPKFFRARRLYEKFRTLAVKCSIGSILVERSLNNFDAFVGGATGV